jgi:hypothetical protein
MKRIVLVLVSLSVFSSLYAQQRDTFQVVNVDYFDQLYQQFDINYDFDIQETVVFDSPLLPAYSMYLIFSHYQGGSLIATLVSWNGTTATVTRKFQGNLETFPFDAEAIASMFLYPSCNVERTTSIYVLKGVN